MKIATADELRIVPDDEASEPAWRRLTRQGWFLAVASPVLLLLFWELLVRVQLLDSRFFPMPSTVLRDLAVQAAAPQLWIHAGYTVSRMLVGFAFGAVPGVLLGIMMGLSPVLRSLLQPAIAAIYPIPKVALFPLVMLMFGLGESSKWVIVGVAVFFQVLMSTLAGVVNIDRVYLDVAADLKARRWQAYRTIALPAALPFIFTGFQLGLGMALIVVVIAENFGTEYGLGYVIWHSWQIFEVRDMYVALILIALLGYLSQLLLARIERAVIPWRRPVRKEHSA
ncbi:ABC transporter permease [Ramlibacter rhizophilus]|uniref:ABC transporter permease n=1 Tax=Ramlibacter rhizophilus TaxID=1781167 RepID=A0A4Z0BGD8_9BURK|nr:ABC transporter permease [Ramlibacter rhizophilus]TFY96968.1 ABC transporter permease [Ramlibacter rhizophilus]